MVVKSLDERISHRPMEYLPPSAPRGPADQLNVTGPPKEEAVNSSRDTSLAASAGPD